MQDRFINRINYDKNKIITGPQSVTYRFNSSTFLLIYIIKACYVVGSAYTAVTVFMVW
jgi:hypothetical protein